MVSANPYPWQADAPTSCVKFGQCPDNCADEAHAPNWTASDRATMEQVGPTQTYMEVLAMVQWLEDLGVNTDSYAAGRYE